MHTGCNAGSRRSCSCDCIVMLRFSTRYTQDRNQIGSVEIASFPILVPENSIRWDSRGETESAHHPMRWLRLSTCLRRL
jgi:hypothetical protein